MAKSAWIAVVVALVVGLLVGRYAVPSRSEDGPYPTPTELEADLEECNGKLREREANVFRWCGGALRPDPKACEAVGATQVGATPQP